VKKRGNANLSIKYEDYNNSISGVSSKYITIYKANNNEALNSYDAKSAQVTISGDTVTLNPNEHLIYGAEHYVKIDAGAFKDEGNTTNKGIDDTTTWNFTVPSGSGPCGCDAFDNCDLPTNVQ